MVWCIAGGYDVPEYDGPVLRREAPQPGLPPRRARRRQSGGMYPKPLRPAREEGMIFDR